MLFIEKKRTEGLLLHSILPEKEDMKVKYYTEDDILVMKLSNNAIDYAEESDWVIVHFDKNDKPVRVEILDATRFLKEEYKALPLSVKQKFFHQATV